MDPLAAQGSPTKGQGQADITTQGLGLPSQDKALGRGLGGVGLLWVRREWRAWL